MADYYPLINKAVAGLDKSTGEARRALYERARTALVAQLRGVQPALSESDITRERLALEEAIRKVEAEAARKSRFDAPPERKRTDRSDIPDPFKAAAPRREPERGASRGRGGSARRVRIDPDRHGGRSAPAGAHAAAGAVGAALAHVRGTEGIPQRRRRRGKSRRRHRAGRPLGARGLQCGAVAEPGIRPPRAADGAGRPARARPPSAAARAAARAAGPRAAAPAVAQPAAAARADPARAAAARASGGARPDAAGAAARHCRAQSEADFEYPSRQERANEYSARDFGPPPDFDDEGARAPERDREAPQRPRARRREAVAAGPDTEERPVRRSRVDLVAYAIVGLVLLARGGRPRLEGAGHRRMGGRPDVADQDRRADDPAAGARAAA